MLEREGFNTDKWLAFGFLNLHSDPRDDIRRAIGKTPEEAVAKLWMELNKLKE